MTIQRDRFALISASAVCETRKAGLSKLSDCVIEVDEPGLFSVIENRKRARDPQASPAGVLAANQTLRTVVLLDMTLPGSSGCRVAKALRRIRPDIQIVLTTAYTQDVALNEFGGNAPRCFIRKPYKTDELVNVLRMAAR